MDESKHDATQVKTEAEFFPGSSVNSFNENPTFKIPINQLTPLGMAVEPLVSAIQIAINDPGGSGLYYVNTKGLKMFQVKESHEFLGALKQESSGAVGGGQATMVSLPFDPTMLFAAVSLIQIEQKLDAIQETQMNILEFLEEDKKSKLTSNLNFLSEEVGKYKLNYNDSVYTNATLATVKIISRDSNADIDFYNNRILKALDDKKIFKRDSDVKKKLENVQLNFKYYQMALYVNSFATFLQVMLQKNFKSDNLELIANSIRDKALKYRELYSKCYAVLEELSGSSIESVIVGGMANINSKAGDIIRKIPALEKINLDDGLMNIGSKLQDIADGKTTKILKAFLSCKDPFVITFLDSLVNLDALYNNPKEICFDADNIYYFNRNKNSIES